MSKLALYCLVVLPLTAFAGPPVLQKQRDAERLYDLATREAQYQSLLATPDIDVEYGKYGRVRQLNGHSGIFLPEVAKLKRGDSAAPILRKLKQILLASESESLVVRQVVHLDKGEHYVFTDQTINGIPVIDARVNFIVAPTGEVVMMNSLFVPQGTGSSVPRLSIPGVKEMLERALVDTETADAGSIQIAAQGSLAFWTDGGQEEAPRLLWMVEANLTSDGEPQAVRFGVDAATGVIRHAQQMRFGLSRSVYSNGYRTTIGSMPGTLIPLWGEGGAPIPNEPQATNLYNKILQPIQAWAGSAFAYDTLGLVAHYGTPGSGYDKASWFVRGADGKPYLVFGDQAAMIDDDIAHEYGHGLFVNHVPGEPYASKYWDEWFAGNEFYADNSSVMTDIWRRNGAVDPIGTWTIWDLRDWSDPSSKGGTFLNRDWYGDWRYAGLGDVPYSNSTIFGHAVYLMINGGYHKRQGQIAWGTVIPSIHVPPSPAAQVKQVLTYGIYRLQVYNRKFSGPQFRDETVGAAQELYGQGSAVANTVDKAWQAVGIRHACTAPPPVPLPNVESFLCGGRHRITWPTLPGTKYHAEIVRSGYPWDLAKTSLDAGSSDVGTGVCSPNVSTTSRFHMRACNGCGCTDWSPAETLQFYQTCL